MYLEHKYIKQEISTTGKWGIDENGNLLIEIKYKKDVYGYLPKEKWYKPRKWGKKATVECVHFAPENYLNLKRVPVFFECSNQPKEEM